MTEQATNARALIEHIAKALVDAKDAVFIDEYEDGDETVIELEVAEADLGKVIALYFYTDLICCGENISEYR